MGLISSRIAFVVAAVLLIGSGAGIVGARLLNARRPENLFATLAEAMPGQPWSGIGQAFNAFCDPYTPVTTRQVVCTLQASSLGFSQLTAYVHDGIIENLTIEGPGVSVGDMTSYWGADYRIGQLGRVRFIRWHQGQYATLPGNVPFRYYLPIKTLSFNRESLP